MTKNTAPLQVDSALVENNPQTGHMDFQFSEGKRKVELTMHPLSAIQVLNLILMRLMQRQEAEVTRGIQTFAIQEIEAKQMPDGRPYLQYRMENGLAFGSSLEREKLEALYHQLGDILASPPPKSGNAKVH